MRYVVYFRNYCDGKKTKHSRFWRIYMFLSPPKCDKVVYDMMPVCLSVRVYIYIYI
jgi:hypothetical protein